MPELSRSLLKWKIRGDRWEMEGLHNLTGADYFMLDRMLDSLSHKLFKDVLVEVGKMTHPKYSQVPDRDEQGKGEMSKYVRKEMDRDSSSAGSGSTHVDL